MKKITLFLTMLLSLLSGQTTIQAAQPKVYTMFDPDFGELTYYYNSNYAENPSSPYIVFYDPATNHKFLSLTDYNDKVFKAIIDPSMKDASLTSMYELFGSLSSMKTIQGLENLNTANVKYMGYMFDGCSSLKSLDLRSFNTANVTHMNSVFYGCSSLESLDLSSFNTANVTDMSGMFIKCSSLKSLDLSSFNNANVTDISGMFYECSELTTIWCNNDWSHIPHESSYVMFSGCKKLVGGKGTTYDENHLDATYARPDGGEASPGYFTKKNLDYEYVDLGLPSGTLWATCNVGAKIPEEYGDYFAWGETETKNEYSWSNYFDAEDEGRTFKKYYNGGQTELLPEDDAATVNWGSEWQMPSRAQVDELYNSDYTILEWTTSNGVNGLRITSKKNRNSIFLPAAGMIINTMIGSVEGDGFYWSRSLNKDRNDLIDILSFNSDRMKVDINARYCGQPVRAVRVQESKAEVYTEFVEETGTLTYYYDDQQASRSGITEPYDPIKYPEAVRFANYFKKVTKVVIDPSMKDAPLTSFRNMSYGGMDSETFVMYVLSNVTSIEGLENLNTSIVTDMNSMFVMYTSLESVDLSSFNTSNVTNMNGMFLGCNKLKTLDLTSFDVSNVTDMRMMFGSCNELTTIYCEQDWSHIPHESSYVMFSGCKKLVGGQGTTFDTNVIDAAYARPDGGPRAPGYFTIHGDLNGDKKVDIADAVCILDVMAAGGDDHTADLNDDDKVDIADFVTVLDIMAKQ